MNRRPQFSVAMMLFVISLLCASLVFLQDRPPLCYTGHVLFALAFSSVPTHAAGGWMAVVKLSMAVVWAWIVFLAIWFLLWSYWLAYSA